MYSKINYTMVGLFVVILGIATLGAGFWLAKYGFERHYDLYDLYFTESVDGLTPDSSVKLKGVDVGRVTLIEVPADDPTRIHVRIRLKEGTPVTEGMYAQLKIQGITGLSYIQIEGGAPGAKPLKGSEGKIPILPTRESLSHRIATETPKLLKKLDGAIESFQALLSPKNRQLVTRILEHGERLTQKAVSLEDRIMALASELNGSLQHFNQSADAIRRETTRLGEMIGSQLPPVLEATRQAGEEISKVARGIDQRLQNGEYDLRRMLRPLQVNLNDLSYRYQELAEELRQLTEHPASILFGSGSLPKGPGE